MLRFILFISLLGFFSNANASLVVLMYHNIADRPYSTSVSESNFDKQMNFLHNQDYVVLDQNQFEEIINVKGSFRDRNYVLITFDDGWKNQLKAIKILNKYGFGGIFFINGSQIKNKSHTYLTFEDLKQNSNIKGITFADHSYTHDFRLYKGVNLDSDFRANQSFLSKNLNVDNKHYALPFGLTSQYYTDYLKNNGVLYIYGVNHGVIDIYSEVFSKNIPRYDINSSVNFEKFIKIVSAKEVLVAKKRKLQ